MYTHVSKCKNNKIKGKKKKSDFSEIKNKHINVLLKKKKKREKGKESYQTHSMKSVLY
jgi:hypothetical protein